MLKVKLCPPARVKGRFNPLNENPGPCACCCVRLMLERPELVRATGKVWLLPIGTLPKARLGGLAINAHWFTPVPCT